MDKETRFQDEMLAAMHTNLSRLVRIPSEEWAYFSMLTSHLKIPKYAHFVQTGEVVKQIGFCVGGLFRLYYITPDGNEYNKNFCGAGDFVTCYSSLLQNAPAYFSIQALADGELLTVEYQDFVSLMDRHSCWERLGRIIAERLYLNKETRERELLMYSAEQRYRAFMERYGSLSDQIPLYHIAAYLGITPVALSRIRRKLNLG